ncbi:hypothetical protein L9F63_003298, partial [Diploptera punctata]
RSGGQDIFKNMTNDCVTTSVPVFSHAKVHFSIGGHQFIGEPVFFSYMPDLIMEHARNVTIKLHNRVGRYLRLQLYFAAKWIMVSEVSFDSVSVSRINTRNDQTKNNIRITSCTENSVINVFVPSSGNVARTPSNSNKLAEALVPCEVEEPEGRQFSEAAMFALARRLILIT